ncbi:MAG: 3-methyl-2-oxobutanoate hydroxymethyltransferase [Candidatus Dormibacteraceae bacterium]
MTTVPDLLRMKSEQRRFAVLTAHDAATAAIVDRAQIPVILVGDSLANAALGYQTTLPITLDEMLHHCRAVARGASNALLVGDLPFMTYEVSPEQALVSAGRMLKEGGMHAVKLEGGSDQAETVRRLSGAGIPVMGHLGLTPQKVHMFGGYKVQGRDERSQAEIAQAAHDLEQAGAFSLVLEAVPAGLAERITAASGIPTIGIGAGPHCDAQVLVLNDMLGMSMRVPRFVKRYGELGTEIERMARSFASEVEEGAFPAPEHVYKA